jgi:polysaccharide export outer membrane protein
MTAPVLFLFAAGLAVNHQPVECFVKDRYPLLEVRVQPADGVSQIRLYFRSEKDTEFRYVPMNLDQERFLGKLPKPKDKAIAIHYYIEVSGTDGSVRQTAEVTAPVVKEAGACPEGVRLAEEGDDKSVRIFAVGQSKKKPGDFGGIDKVVREEATPPAGESAPTATATPAPPPPAPGVPSPGTAPAAAAPAPVATPFPRPEEPQEYTIGPEDILRITVFGHEDLTQTTVVQQDGNLIFPLIGRLKASDLTPKELERKITTLLAQGYVRSPQVTVSVQEYRSKNVFVVGEVSRPGSFSIAGRMTVLELLAKAGPTGSAGAEVIIVRPKTATQGPMVPMDLTSGAIDPNVAAQADIIRVNVRDIQMGQLDKNIFVRPNDTIFVTEAAKVFVTGEVRSPGAITFAPGMTVRKAIYTAGGFTADASQGRLRVVREVEGKTKEDKIGLDEPVQPGDTIIVKAKLF